MFQILKFKVLVASVAVFLGVTQTVLAASFPNDEYTVFSFGDVQYSGSDFEGRTAALGNFAFKDFHLDVSQRTGAANLVVGGNVSLLRGQVRGGGISAGGSVDLQQVVVQGDLAAAGQLRTFHASYLRFFPGLPPEVKALEAVGASIREKSRALSQLPPNQRAFLVGGVLRFQGGVSPVAVFQISAQALQRASVLSIGGRSSGIFVINVIGPEAAFQKTDVKLATGILPGQVIFNFVDAKSLKISTAGSDKFGIPATVLAPGAAAEFTDGLITGALFVGSLKGDGQVNPWPFVWDRF